MEFNWLSELLKHKHWAGATLGAGLTIIYLNKIDLIPPITDPTSWVPMLTVYAGWFVTLAIADKTFGIGKKRWGESARQKRVDKQQRDASAIQVQAIAQAQERHIQQMAALTANQKITLGYIKHKGHADFQACSTDEDIRALTKLRFIRLTAHLPQSQAMFSVPPYIWEAIVIPNEAKALEKSPWVIRRNRRRV